MTEYSFTIGILTLSDKGARGVGEVTHYRVIPDDLETIVETLVDWVDRDGVDLVLTTGGTGLSPRDVTPEATARVLDWEIPGMAEAMRAASMKKTPHAMLSRARAGVRRQSIIINLPGSPKGVRENLEVVLPALTHGLKKLKGDPTDCAR
jgi:molybdenum cofactor synthesis domain-containing protein